MNYKVQVTQCLKYTDTIEGNFDNLKEVESFIRLVMAHCKNVKVTISVTKDGNSEIDMED